MYLFVTGTSSLVPDRCLIRVTSYFWFNVTGIGYALAKEFLKAGDNVLICSRSGTQQSCIN